ncbi:MAG: hypothetical protein ABIO83_05130 [Ilumatobacteraceae bacterium]
MGKRKQGDRLKQEVENQSEQLRSLAGEIDRHADGAGLLSRASVGTMRRWADLLRSIADELTEAVNDERNGRGRVFVLNRMTSSALAGLVVLAPTINHVGSSLADRYLLPERVESEIEQAQSGTESITEALEASSTDSEHGEQDQEADDADALRREVDAAMLALELSDEMLGVEYVVNSSFGPTTVEVTPRPGSPSSWTLAAPHDDEPWTRDVDLSPGHGLADVESEVNRWIDNEADRRAMQIAEDRVIQDEIDRRRGK